MIHASLTTAYAVVKDCQAQHGEAKGDLVAFVVGVVLFAVVIGALDARLPWPRPAGGRR